MDISKLNPFRKPTSQELARIELENAKRYLLISQSQAEYHNKMAEYYQGTIARLSQYLEQ